MHNRYMALALQIAKKGIFTVGANPMVGCVIVRDNQIIATGYHQQFGGNHAEINALEKINFNAQNADIYLSLEPCSHQGKTPPCVHKIIKAHPKKVIIATLDKNPKVSSVKLLQDSGIEVITGVLSAQATKLNRGFFKRMQTKIPFVSSKIASSLDGKTAMKSGESKWITGEYARADVQKLRAQHQAIITGSGTVLTDNPHLNVRDKNQPSPIKIVMDRSGKITDKSLNIFKGEKTIITDKTPIQVLKMLGEMQINSVLIEAGGRLNAAFLQKNLIDEYIIYQAAIIMGAQAHSMFAMTIKNMADKINLKVQDIRIIGKDIKIIAHPQCKP